MCDIEPNEIECEQGSELRLALHFCAAGGSDERGDDGIDEHDCGCVECGDCEQERAMPNGSERNCGICLGVIEQRFREMVQWGGIECECFGNIDSEDWKSEPCCELWRSISEWEQLCANEFCHDRFD